MEPVSRWTQTAIKEGQGHAYFTFFQFAEGLAEYRQRHFTNAVEWMQRVLVKTGEERFRDVQASMVLAMAQYQLNQLDQARASLAEGFGIADKHLPKLESGDLGGSWHDWLIAHILVSEAKALVEGKSESSSIDGKAQ